MHEWRPNAERVLDGFHIVSWMTDALDEVRERLWNQARRDGDDKAVKRMRGVKHAVPKNPGDLTGRREAPQLFNSTTKVTSRHTHADARMRARLQQRAVPAVRWQASVS